MELFLQGIGRFYLSGSSSDITPLLIISLILEINLALYLYKLVVVQINRGGKFNPPELAIICNNCEVDTLLDVNAELFKVFVLRWEMKKCLWLDMKMLKQTTLISLVSLFSCRLI